MTNKFRDEAELEVVEKAVKTIAIARKSHQIIEDNVEEFDAALNELCEKWYKEFEHKTNAEMAMFLLEDLLESVKR